MSWYRVGGFILTIKETHELGSHVSGKYFEEKDFWNAFLALDKVVVRHGGMLRTVRDDVMVITRLSKYRPRRNGNNDVVPMSEGRREQKARLLLQEQGVCAMQIH
jgi:hypothetical protein